MNRPPGTQTSKPRIQYNGLSGSTPTTVYGWSFRIKVFPKMPGSDPNLLSQNPRPMMATRLAPGRSSSSVKSRPNPGGRPNTLKKDAEAFMPFKCSACPRPVMLKLIACKADMDWKEWLCSFQSKYSG